MKTYQPITPLFGFTISTNLNDRFCIRFAGTTDANFDGISVLNTSLSASDAARLAWQIPDYVGDNLRAGSFIAPLDSHSLSYFTAVNINPTFYTAGFEVFPLHPSDFNLFTR